MSENQETRLVGGPGEDTLASVWREACRHIEIQECAGDIARLLASRLPIGQFLVRRVNADRHELETVVTVALRGSLSTMGPPTHAFGPTAWGQLMAWASAGNIFDLSDGGAPGGVGDAVPAEVLAAGPVLLGPLCNTREAVGVMLLVGVAGTQWRAEHLTLARRLLEPLGVALENDRRLQELNALREAAEADRRSLLSRVGRQDLNEEVIGAQTGLRTVMERVELVAQSDVPVLILGETGTGKEVVSRAIHVRSKRADGPFIRVNCGAIPTELIDSQLFGHEKGSFTGAHEQHQGWFERANGGTLFLDEIGELPLAAQVRLLRVLQDHQVERVGAKRPVHINVRIVAATHRDLASMVKMYTFREDLWYRINVFPILLPRLRERLEDIPALVAHLAQRAATRFGLPMVAPTPVDLRLLANYPWPGNIRELGAVIDRAVILGNGRALEVATSLGFAQAFPAAPPSNEPTYYEVIPEVTHPLVPIGPTHAPADCDRIMTLDAAMRAHIERALLSTRGRIEGPGGTAEVLGINPHTLRARMRKLGIRWAQYRP